ncbi:hypothetical protein ACFYY8_31690 [Streptosporangium sp. NPDC001559]|uniref:hypothetical protein n=1 Tax=Streptosporangium sp. NPDC001559 TaxID=3366187 RepID=UPI0036E5767C
MDVGQIYDSQASFTFRQTPADLTNQRLRPALDDVHPLWGVVVHFPAWLADPATPSNGDHWEIFPHVLLEEYCSRFGFDVDELPTIVDAVLHQHAKIPDPSDALAWQQPAAAAVMRAVADFPDHLDPRMPYAERREAVLARAAAAKKHLIVMEAAPQEDRQGALDWRAACIAQAAEEAEQSSVPLAPQFTVDVNVHAPENPLEPILAARLDPARVAARRARDEYLAASTGQYVDRARLALTGPRVFGSNRMVPPLG